MPPFVLTVLKIVFLALLYFFIYRAIRSAVVDLRTPVRATAGAGPGRSRAKESARPAQKGKPPRTVVVIDDKGAKVGTHQLNGQLQIGRAEACQIRLSDTYVSQFHARLFGRDGSWFVEDLGSTNGTYLNQRRVTGTAEIRAGDRLRMGKTTLELRR